MIPDDAGFKTGGWDMNKYRQHARDDDIAMRNAEERTYQVIPDEAVEAAARVLALSDHRRTPSSWDELAVTDDPEDDWRESYRDTARRTLAAASPYLKGGNS